MAKRKSASHVETTTVDMSTCTPASTSPPSVKKPRNTLPSDSKPMPTADEPSKETCRRTVSAQQPTEIFRSDRLQGNMQQLGDMWEHQMEMLHDALDAQEYHPGFWKPCSRCLEDRRCHLVKDCPCPRCLENPGWLRKIEPQIEHRAIGIAQYRSRNRFQSPLYCRDCICEMHRHSPFDWVERFENGFFVKKDLSELGFVCHLGHEGAPCPKNLESNIKTKAFTVVHKNGFHVVQIRRCACLVNNTAAGIDTDLKQLLYAGLFPATLTRVETLFTFEVLEEHRIHTMKSKMPLLDYVRALSRLTKSQQLGESPTQLKVRTSSDLSQCDSQVFADGVSSFQHGVSTVGCAARRTH